MNSSVYVVVVGGVVISSGSCLCDFCLVELYTVVQNGLLPLPWVQLYGNKL